MPGRLEMRTTGKDHGQGGGGRLVEHQIQQLQGRRIGPVQIFQDKERRVEPMVTHPAPPQTRTCAINAYGSSGRASATRGTVQEGSGDTIGERKVSLVYHTSWNALPDVAFPPVGRLGFTSPHSTVLCDATTATSPSRGPSLVARSPIPCVLLAVCGLPAGLVAWSKRPTHARAFGHPVPHSGSVTRSQMALPSSRVPPVQTCPALRPRW